MPHHEWGDEDFDWGALYKARNYIRLNTRHVRLGLHMKEKWGTLRVSVWPFIGNLHSILYPGYMYNQYKYAWMWKADCWLRRHCPQWIVRKVQRWQLLALKKAWLEAADLWPHIREEILDEYDFVVDWKEVEGG